MNLELTDEQVALRDTVRRYLSEKAGVTDHVRTMLDDPSGTTDTVWRGLVGLGTTSLLIPASCGGDGMTMMQDLRDIAAEIELLVDDHLWSLPKYREMVYMM